MKSPIGGFPINAAHGFLGMVARLLVDQNPDFIAVASDEAWRPQWRVDLIDSYKTHRVAAIEDPTTPTAIAEDALESQVPLVFEILEGCGIRVVGFEDHEAEDVIGTLSARAPGEVRIVSGDRDLFQLVRDPDIKVLYPKRGVSELLEVNESYIESKYGIPGRSYADFAVMRGDPSDGLPGVKGIGEKSAAALLNKYGSLEAAIEAAITGPAAGTLGRIAMSLDYLDRAVRVVTIPLDLPIPQVDLTRPRQPPPSEVIDLAEDHALAGAVRRLSAAIDSGQRVGT